MQFPDTRGAEIPAFYFKPDQFIRVEIYEGIIIQQQKHDIH